MPVAPLAGARIEIGKLSAAHAVLTVAPLAGARIEILLDRETEQGLRSLPSRERGLKYASKDNVYSDDGRSPRGSAD